MTPERCTECFRPVVRNRHMGIIPEGWARYDGRGLCTQCRRKLARAGATLPPRAPRRDVGQPTARTLDGLAGYLAGRARRLERAQRVERAQRAGGAR